MSHRTCCSLGAALLLVLAFSPAHAGESRPNVLFIAVDDLRPEVGAYGASAITPHIDRLAQSGTRFDRAYCQQAVCGASRVSIMCGLYPTKTQEQTFHVDGWRQRHPAVVTMNQHLRSHGYRTIGMGKIYHNTGGPDIDPDNWDQWAQSRSNTYALEENNQLHAANRSARRQGKRKLDVAERYPNRSPSLPMPTRGPMTECAPVDDDSYSDGQLAARAVASLEELAEETDQPFFLAVGFTKPHLPFTAPQTYWDLYQRSDFAMPANRGIPPGYLKRAANLEASELWGYTDFEGEMPTDFSDALNLRLLHGYAAATSYVDACIGRVLDALEQTGLDENTVVVLWGDHGWKLGDHSSWCKHTNFECDTRVPLIVRDPRHTQSRSSDQLVELLDVYPTLCDMVGVPIPEQCQGVSFRSQLTNPEAASREDAYSSYPSGKNTTGHSLRFGKYRYTEWRHNKSGAIEARVLTDLEADPGEVTNMLDDPEHHGVGQAAGERLDERIQQARR